MFDRYFTGHGEDPDDYEPPRLAFERRSTHTARKLHHCDCCEGFIKPGERYSAHTFLDDEGFHFSKSHEDTQICAAERVEVEAWQAKQVWWDDDL